MADSLRPAVLRLSRHLRREAQRVGISVTDAQLLGLISKRQGIGVSGLAELENMSRPSMSAHVKRLEAAGWIRRDPLPGGDQRRMRLILTEQGERSLSAIRRSRNDWLAGQIARLPSAERVALAAAIAALTQLSDVRP
ncbi:MAG: MarR family transcriptional regulator [Sphingomonas sp.]